MAHVIIIALVTHLELTILLLLLDFHQLQEMNHLLTLICHLVEALTIMGMILSVEDILSLP